MFEIMKQQPLPLLSMQDLTLRAVKQPCILSLSQGGPRVGGQESGKSLPEWGPQEPLLWLTLPTAMVQHFIRSISWGVRGAGVVVQSIAQFWQGNDEKLRLCNV